MQRFLDYIAKKMADALIKQIGLDGFRVAVLDIQPGDVIVVNAGEVIPDKGWEDIKSKLEKIFPHNQVIGMEGTLDLSIVREREKANDARSETHTN